MFVIKRYKVAYISKLTRTNRAGRILIRLFSLSMGGLISLSISSYKYFSNFFEDKRMMFISKRNKIGDLYYLESTVSRKVYGAETEAWIKGE